MWDPFPVEFNRSYKTSRVRADLEPKTRTTICPCMTRSTNRTKFSSLLQAPLTSIVSRCQLIWSPWPRVHTISPSIVSQSIINSFLIKHSMALKSELITTTSLSPQARTRSKTLTLPIIINLVFKAIARQLVTLSSSKTNRTHKLMMSLKNGCLMSIRSSLTIRREAQMEVDKLEFRIQVTMSKLVIMVGIWLCNQKLV